MAKFNPLSTRPQKVVMLGLGASIADYVQHQVSQDLILEYDEIWTCNMGLRIFRHDKLWVMDDLRNQARKLPTYGRLLAEHDRPIITSQPYPEFPQSWRYPIEEISAAVGDDFFRNTVCYAIAFAMVRGVKDLTLYGCDFFYPQLDVREEGSMNAAYFLGLARHFGMTFHIPPSSTLLSAHLSKEVEGKPRRPLYGYAVQPFYKEEAENNAVGTGKSPRIRAPKGVNAGATNTGEPIRQVKVGTGQPAPVRATGKNLQRRRSRNNRPAGVVLDAGQAVDSSSPGRVRARFTDGREENVVLSIPDANTAARIRTASGDVHAKN